MSISKLLNPVDDWRIKLIPFEDSSAPKVIKPEPLVLLGLFGFVGSMFGLVLLDGKKSFLLALAAVSFGLMLFSLLSKGRRKRKNWAKLPAQLIDKEMRKARGIKGTTVWVFRFLCEFEFEGTTYTVTPSYWLNAGGGHYTQSQAERAKQKAEKMMEKLVRFDGSCELWVNPENPLETEIVGHDIKDKLLH